MSQNPPKRLRLSRPTEVVAARTKALVKRRFGSVEKLSAALADVGVPLSRAVLANMLNGRRDSISLEEWLALAYVLDVAPVHLLVPVEDFDGEDWYAACPDRFLSPGHVRAWVRGYWCPPGSDPRTYFAEVPTAEFEPKQPTSEQITERGTELDERRALDRWVEEHRG